MYRRIETINDRIGLKTGLCFGETTEAVFDVWAPYLRAVGTGKNSRYFFTEKGWKIVGRKVIKTMQKDGLRYRIIKVKHRDVDVMAGDDLEVAVRFRKQRRKDVSMKTAMLSVLTLAASICLAGSTSGGDEANRFNFDNPRAKSIVIRMDRDLDKLRDDYEKAVNARKIKAIVELNQIAEAGGINRSEIVKIDAAIAELRVGWTPASENQKWARLDRQGDRMDFKFSSDGAITCLTRTSAANSWKSSDGDVVINDSSRYRVIDMKVFIGGKPGDKPFLFVPLIFD